MKNYFLVSLLFLSALFNTACVRTSNQDSLNVNAPKYNESISYSVNATWLGGGKLHINKGMAVVVMATKNRCILATAKHVVQNTSSVVVSSLDSHVKIKAEVIYRDNLEDVAFLSFATNHKYRVPVIALDENTLIGKRIIAFNYLLGDKYQIATGQIVDFWQLPSNQIFMVAKLPIKEGFSGSGVFDVEGNLVGLVSGKAADKRVDIAYLVSGPKIVFALQRFL